MFVFECGARVPSRTSSHVRTHTHIHTRVHTHTYLRVYVLDFGSLLSAESRGRKRNKHGGWCTMGRHTLNQRLHREYPDGSAYRLSDRTTVCGSHLLSFPYTHEQMQMISVAFKTHINRQSRQMELTIPNGIDSHGTWK